MEYIKYMIYVCVGIVHVEFTCLSVKKDKINVLLHVLES